MITNIGQIEAARSTIAGKVRRTPTLALELIRTALPTKAKVSLKLESLQVTGSFKARGAMNKLLGTPPPPPPQSRAGGGLRGFRCRCPGDHFRA